MFSHTVRKLALALGLICWPVAAISGVTGYYNDHKGLGVIQVSPCKGGLCGRVVAVKKKVQDPSKYCKMTVFYGLKKQPNGSWDKGTIVNPGNGSTYSLQLRSSGGKLFMRGYLGTPAMGQDFVWNRAGKFERCDKVKQNVDKTPPVVNETIDKIRPKPNSNAEKLGPDLIPRPKKRGIE
jgi:uncharacterized protein (DUF2147 family)